MPFYNMPFKSEAQRRFMYAHNPTLAKEFESKTPANKKLPKKVRAKKVTPANSKRNVKVVSRKKHG